MSNIVTPSDEKASSSLHPDTNNGGSSNSSHDTTIKTDQHPHPSNVAHHETIHPSTTLASHRQHQQYSKLERLMPPSMRRVYASPYSQVVLVGLVAFLCPGMFNALSGMGGAGQVDPTYANLANIALYVTFASVSSFAGSIHNKLGSRLTLWLGSLGYCLYVASFLSYNYTENEGFVVASGAILGICASLFWSSQGALMLCYPTEGQKARFVSIFWVVFNMGGVVGAAIAMGLSWNSGTSETLGNGVYAAFVALTFCGGLVSALLKDPATLIRSDGTSVVVPASTTWSKEIQGLYRLLKSDPWVVFLFPLFFASNFFYTWQNQDLNAKVFTLRTRAFNSLLYWFAQMIGALLLSVLLDYPKLRRQNRAWGGWAVVFIVVFAVWGGSYAVQTRYTRTSLSAGWPLDITDGSEAGGIIVLYLFSGFMDSLWQTFTYWLLGALSNDISKLAILVSWYKAIQSAGAATAYGLDYSLRPYMEILGVTWGLCGLGLVCAVPVLMLRVKDHTDPLGEKTVVGREWEVQKGMQDGLERTGKVPEALQGVDDIEERAEHAKEKI